MSCKRLQPFNSSTTTKVRDTLFCRTQLSLFTSHITERSITSTNLCNAIGPPMQSLNPRYPSADRLCVKLKNCMRLNGLTNVLYDQCATFSTRESFGQFSRHRRLASIAFEALTRILCVLRFALPFLKLSLTPFSVSPNQLLSSSTNRQGTSSGATPLFTVLLTRLRYTVRSSLLAY